MSIVQKLEPTSSSEQISMETVNCQQMRLPQAQKFVMANRVYPALKVNKAMMESMAIMEMEVLLI